MHSNKANFTSNSISFKHTPIIIGFSRVTSPGKSTEVWMEIDQPETAKNSSVGTAKRYTIHMTPAEARDTARRLLAEADKADGLIKPLKPGRGE
jgi:hypothetical protein